MRRRTHATIGGLMVALIVCAMGLAVLRFADEELAAVVRFVSLLVFGVGLFRVVHGSEEGRAFWRGFLLMGGGYALLTLDAGLPRTFLDALPTTRALDAIRPLVLGPAGMERSESTRIAFEQGIDLGPWIDPTAFREVGHVLFALVFGGLGGWSSRKVWMIGRGSCPNDDD